MQQADETFLTTTQEPRKLSIAISRYFSGELTEPDLKERYEKFLRQRSRAAMLQIIKDGSFQEMVKLAEGGFLTHALYQEAILKTADDRPNRNDRLSTPAAGKAGRRKNKRSFCSRFLMKAVH